MKYKIEYKNIDELKPHKTEKTKNHQTRNSNKKEW